jgi:hypothetical protein
MILKIREDYLECLYQTALRRNSKRNSQKHRNIQVTVNKHPVRSAVWHQNN